MQAACSIARESLKRFTSVSRPFSLSHRNYAGSSTTISEAPPESKTTNPSLSASSRARTKMGAWQVHSYGGIEELQYSDKLKVPQIRSSGECLVRVRTTSVNPIDMAMLRGYGATLLNMVRDQPGSDIEFPLTLGREFCGELVQKGMGVDDATLKLGDRVWGVVPVSHTCGAHAEYVVVSSSCLAPAPKELDDNEAASVLYAGLTAWSGLYITGGLGGVCGATSSAGGGANKRVLVLGGSGSVGSLAIQMLKSQGAQVLATCSEDAVEMVRNLGTDCVVDYSNPVDMDHLRDYAPYDIVLDCAGQGDKHAADIKYDFCQYITFNSPLLSNIDKQGVALGAMQNVSDLLQTNMRSASQNGGLVKWGYFLPAPHGIQFIQRLVERRKLIPQIDSSFEFSQLPKAFERLKSGHLRGKVVVKVKD